MSRVLVLGGGGMAGHMVRLVLTEFGHDVSALGRSPAPSGEWNQVNVEDDRALKNYLIQERPEVVVNCIGILIKESESNPERAIRINSLLPHVLSRYGRELGYRLIHLSSDCVFSGKDGPYQESDFRDADDIYGRTKAIGEVVNNYDLTIRTSIVGPELKHEGSGLFGWFMRQKGSVKGYASAQWSGVTTLELAKAINSAIFDGTTGLVHLTNEVSISKYDLLKIFQELWVRLDLKIELDNTHVSCRGLLRSRADYKYSVPSYKKMCEEMKLFMQEHQEHYQQYEKTASGN